MLNAITNVYMTFFFLLTMDDVFKCTYIHDTRFVELKIRKMLIKFDNFFFFNVITRLFRSNLKIIIPSIERRGTENTVGKNPSTNFLENTCANDTLIFIRLFHDAP